MNPAARPGEPFLPQVVRFGRCEVRLDTRQVLLDGREQLVRRRVFDLIVYLLRHRPRTVSHQELLLALWQRRQAAPSLLARSIMEARRTLGETAEEAHCIVSVHGVGYRFAATVGVIPAADPTTSPDDSGSDPVTEEVSEVRALLLQAREAQFERRYDAAQALAREAMARAEVLGSHAERVRAMLRLAAAALQTGRAQDSARLVADALRIAKAEGQPALIAEVRIEAGSVHLVAGDLETGVRHLRDALEVLSQRGHEAEATRCMNWLSLALSRDGDLDGALEMCRRSIRIGASQPSAHHALLNRLNEVRFLAALGDREAATGHAAVARDYYEQGLACSGAVLQDLSAPRHRSLWLTTLSNRALLLERLDRLEEAWGATEQYDEELAALPEDLSYVGQGNRPLIMMQRARLLARGGRLRDAVAQASKALEEAERTDERLNEQDELYRQAAGIAARAGDLATALRWQTACCDALVRGQRGRAASLAAVLAAELNTSDLQLQLDTALARQRELALENAELRRRLQLLEGALPICPETGLADRTHLETAFGPAHRHARTRKLPMCLGLLQLDNTAELVSLLSPLAMNNLWRQVAELLVTYGDIAHPAVRLGPGQVAFRVCDAGLDMAQSLGAELVSHLERRFGKDPALVVKPRWRCSWADAAREGSVQACIERLTA